MSLRSLNCTKKKTTKAHKATAYGPCFVPVFDRRKRKKGSERGKAPFSAKKKKKILAQNNKFVGVPSFFKQLSQ